MAVTFYTKNPASLLKDFKEKINQTEPKGSITTWELTSGGQFTHLGKQYVGDAFFSATTTEDQLVFNIIRPKDKAVSGLAYAYYHGHLIETFLNHFDKSFSSASASALATKGDKVLAPS